MIGRLIQSNPFCLLDVDQIFFDKEKYKQKFESVIFEYFNYIKQKIDQESIFRLLSPLLYIFFGVPNGKKFKAEIHQKIKNYEK